MKIFRWSVKAIDWNEIQYYCIPHDVYSVLDSEMIHLLNYAVVYLNVYGYSFMFVFYIYSTFVVFGWDEWCKKVFRNFICGDESDVWSIHWYYYFVNLRARWITASCLNSAVPYLLFLFHWPESSKRKNNQDQQKQQLLHHQMFLD